jgi:hypothetical protein
MDQTNNSDVKNNQNESNAPQEVKINPETQKFISLAPITYNLKNKLTKAIESLLQVQKDIFTKREDLLNKRQLIKEKILSLTETKKVRLDMDEFEKSEKHATEYIKLLDGILNELNNEIGYYYIFVSEEKPPVEKIVVPINAPDVLEDYLETQAGGINRYLKNVKHNISISCSRYLFGCDEQLKHLSFVESYIKSKEAEKKLPH